MWQDAPRAVRMDDSSLNLVPAHPTLALAASSAPPPAPSVSPRYQNLGTYSRVPEQLNIKAVAGACKVIDGCSPELCSATVSVVSAGICHRNKVNSIAWLYRRAQPKDSIHYITLASRLVHSQPFSAILSRQDPPLNSISCSRNQHCFLTSPWRHYIF